jgi:pilus assembly protein FimV
MPAPSPLRSACLLALLAATGSAAALGLGQIRVKSAPGEPLIAEIPVISSDPAELRDLRAALASPATFTRVGLEPPVGVVADLDFVTTVDASGRAIIRVTSTQPITQPMLTFLVEVDWGQGRLVREYSALVDAPTSVATAPVMPVQAPRVATPALIQRPQAPVAEAARTVDPPPAPQPVRPSRPLEPQPVAAAQTQSQPPSDAYTVRAGDTLSGIAPRLAPEGVTAAQTMIGLLRSNPQAFIGGDINQLRRGSVLRVPAVSELESVDARAAAALVRSHARQWREARTQPQAEMASRGAVPAAAAPATAAVARAAPSGGRLEIVPPGAAKAARAGTQSGIAAGSEGEMLRQELQQTKETLATRDAELQELKSRVAELERLRTDQQKLIALKDAELSAAQQRPGEAEPSAAASPMPWIIGAAVLLLGLLAGAWARRRRKPVFRAPATRPASIADAFAPVEPSPLPAAAGAPVQPPGAAPVVSAPVAEPSWGGRATRPRTPGPGANAPASAARPTWHAGVVAELEAVATPAPAPATPVDAAGVERLELAQAYLDLGDTENARRLLTEVAGSDDATARGVASRMLQGLG